MKLKLPPNTEMMEFIRERMAIQKNKQAAIFTYLSSLNFKKKKL
jgi:hypothetical protein